MSLTKEERVTMARDMKSNRKFDGDTDIPVECRKFADLTDKETIERPKINGWPYKLYIHTAKNRTRNCPVHINIHGGGWVIGHMPNDTLWSAWLANQIRGIVVDVDYTTTEFAPYSVAFEQCLDAARFVFAYISDWDGDPKRVSVGGYSAGGQLAISIAVTSQMRNEYLPFCLLINGYGPNDMRYDEYAAKACPEYWKTQEFRGAGFGVLLSDDNAALMESPILDFLCAPDEVLASLPPTMIIGASDDPFHLQNLEQGKRLAALGVEVTMKVYPDTFHGFIPHFMKHWEEAGSLIVRGIKAARR